MDAKHAEAEDDWLVNIPISKEVGALHAKLEAIRGVLVPIAEIDWAGKWRILKAIDLTRD